MKVVLWIIRLAVIGFGAIATTYAIMYFQVYTKTGFAQSDSEFLYGFPFSFYFTAFNGRLSGLHKPFNALLDIAFYFVLFLAVYLIYRRMKNKRSGEE